MFQRTKLKEWNGSRERWQVELDGRKNEMVGERWQKERDGRRKMVAGRITWQVELSGR